MTRLELAASTTPTDQNIPSFAVVVMLLLFISNCVIINAYVRSLTHRFVYAKEACKSEKCEWKIIAKWRIHLGMVGDSKRYLKITEDLPENSCAKDPIDVKSVSFFQTEMCSA